MNMYTKQRYDPEKHHRHSIRLFGYDYSCEGVYFVTICCHHKVCLFGEIVDGEMMLNDAGRIAEQEWLNTENIRSGDVALHDFVIMPNHMHAIIEIIHSPRRGVSHTPLDVCPDVSTDTSPTDTRGVCDTPLQSPSRTLGAIIRGYKSAVSKQLGFSVWQRNYYEHIIRCGRSYRFITAYILDNPANWSDDELYVEPVPLTRF